MPAHMYSYEWEEYEPGDAGSYVSPLVWGKDHWSTLGYCAARAVNNKGVLDNRNLRVNSRLHREFAHTAGTFLDIKEYPTRLKPAELSLEEIRTAIRRGPAVLEGRNLLHRHDDVSCIEDFVAAGLMRVWTRVVKDRAFNNSEIYVEFTDLGLEVAGALHAHKVAGGNWAEFDPLEVWEELRQ